MSDAPESWTDQATEFAQQLLGEKQLAKMAEFKRVPPIIKNGAQEGLPAIVAGTLLLWRAVRLTRHGYLKAVAKATLGVAVFYIGVRQRRLNTIGTSSEERFAGDITTNDHDRLDGKEQSAAKAGDPDRRHDLDEESEPTMSGKNGNRRELGRDISEDMSDQAFIADAETQGRSQPSLNADVHDPRRGAGDEELDLSETALADNSTENKESGNSDVPEEERQQGETDPDAPQAKDDDDNGEGDTVGPDMEWNDEDGSERSG